MKKVMFLLAVAGMFAFTACNNNAETTTEEPAAPETEAVEAQPAEAEAEATVEVEATEAAAEETAQVSE